MAAPIRTTGLAFPLELDSGKHTLISGAELIQSSLKTLLSWPLFTRQFNGDFGSRIHEAIEDQNDDVLITLVRRFTIDSITQWEQRIELQNIEMFRPEPTRLSVNVTYLIKENNIQDTLHYNFYIN